MIELHVEGQLVLRGTAGPRTTRPGGTFLQGDILSCDNIIIARDKWGRTNKDTDVENCGLYLALQWRQAKK